MTSFQMHIFSPSPSRTFDDKSTKRCIANKFRDVLCLNYKSWARISHLLKGNLFCLITVQYPNLTAVRFLQIQLDSTAMQSNVRSKRARAQCTVAENTLFDGTLYHLGTRYSFIWSFCCFGYI